jgi:hypothetical protein
MIISNVFTIAKPEKTAPATYGGKIVVCHPGITEVANPSIQYAQKVQEE